MAAATRLDFNFGFTPPCGRSLLALEQHCLIFYDCTSAHVYHIKFAIIKSILACINLKKKIFWASCFLQCVAAHSQVLDVIAYVWSLSECKGVNIISCMPL